jgi:hypothetical protein
MAWKVVPGDLGVYGAQRKREQPQIAPFAAAAYSTFASGQPGMITNMALQRTAARFLIGLALKTQQGLSPTQKTPQYQ